MKAHVYVTLKEEVLDPQGDAVRQALGTLGYQGVKRARVGKLIVLDVDASDRKQAEADLDAMCKKLLSNPVIEDYRFEIVAGS
jgi:phosphoribosylformylglycinamidine synthase PurS subunit